MSNSQLNSTQVVDYRPGFFISIIIPYLFDPSEIREGLEREVLDDNTQIRYIDRYLESLGAQTIVIEEFYIDRHYMDEFQRYYSNEFHCPKNYCTRIHVFRQRFTENDFFSVQSNPTEENIKFYEDFEDTDDFIPNYLGYIVIRPIHRALVGRTFLSPLKPSISNPSSPSHILTRSLQATYIQQVNLKGFRLFIRGLPYQRQDQRVSACATTAIWSALSKVAKGDGMRAPTPSEITEAATKNTLFDRPYPQEGLHYIQILEAIRSNKFQPLMLSPKELGYELFKMNLAAYLKSAIPVIIGLERDSDEDGHAITICGLCEDAQYGDTFEYVIDSNTYSLRSDLMRWGKLYFHDDRIGPYSRGTIYKSTKSSPVLQIPIDDLGNVEEWDISEMIIPLYHKVRATVNDLIKFSGMWVKHINKTYNIPLESSSFSVYFRRSSKVLNDIINSEHITRDKIDFLNNINLSRYTGIVEIFQKIDGENKLLIRFILDTTDRIEWSSYDFCQILGVITHLSKTGIFELR